MAIPLFKSLLAASTVGLASPVNKLEKVIDILRSQGRASQPIPGISVIDDQRVITFAHVHPKFMTEHAESEKLLENCRRSRIGPSLEFYRAALVVRVTCGPKHANY